MMVPSPVLITMVSATTAKLTGNTTGPDAVLKAIRPIPPGAIRRRHSAGVSLSLTGWPDGSPRPGGPPPRPPRAPARPHRAGPEQRGRRGLQRRGERPQRGRAGPGRIPLQVLQVPQAHPGARGDLGLTEPQLGPAQRDALAQVTWVGRRRPARCLSLLLGSFSFYSFWPGYILNGHRDRGVTSPVAAGPRTPLHLLGSLGYRMRGRRLRTSPSLSRPEPGREWPWPCPAGTFVSHQALSVAQGRRGPVVPARG